MGISRRQSAQDAAWPAVGLAAGAITERNIMRISLRIALAASAAMLAIGAAQAQELTLKIGTEGAYPPFNNLTADGKLEGFDIDIANALCEEMKAKCEFVTQDWDGIIPALQAGKFDAIIASMSITDERKQKVDFTNKYYNTPPAIAAPKDTDIKGVTKEDLAGKTLGAATATTHYNYAEKTYTDTTLKGYPSSQEFLLDIANGRVDAVTDDISVLEEWLKTPDGACCKIVGTITPVSEIHGEGAGIAVRKGETDLVNKFNAAIDAIRANGKYKEINDKYFSYDVYGGES
jgi:polar amino acid transport system substrate-binding protein